MNHIGHVDSTALDVVGIFTKEMLVDSLLEELEPVIELRFVHLSFSDELEVRGEGVTFVAAAPEEDGFPESIHSRKMGLPVVAYRFVKNRANDLVLADGVVEGIDEEFDTGTVGEIGKCSRHGI